MNRRINIRKVITWMFLVASAFLISAAFTITRGPRNTEAAAAKTSHILSNRMTLLDNYVSRVLEEESDSWTNIEDFPSDMVIYRYVNGALKSWHGVFPLINDDISNKIVFQAITNRSENIASPLSWLKEEPSFVNYGSKWYVAKNVSREDVTVICGLEIANTLDENSENGVNRRLHLSDAFSVEPLSTSGGSPVYLGPQPLFKVISQSDYAASAPDVLLIWLSLIMYMVGSILFVSNKKTLPRVILASIGLFAITLSIYIWSNDKSEVSGVFSPTLYADGPIFSSLGVQVLVAIFIFMVAIYTYVARHGSARHMLSSRKSALNHLILIVLLIVGLIAYCCWAFKSIILNSNITLDLFKVRELTWYTAIVHLIFTALAVAVLLLAQMARPAVSMLFSFRYDVFSRGGRLFFSTIVALMMVLGTSILGFKKEHNVETLWANRLSMDRDISLEINLRSIENQIATDRFLASVSALDNTATLIQNRLQEMYFTRLMFDYDMSVRIFNQDSNPQDIQYYNDRLRGGSIIAPNSRFIYTRHETGGPHYTGVFRYFNEYGMSTVLVEIEPKASRGYRGYSGILGHTPPGQVVLPAKYSYAHYIDEKCVTNWGDYPYAIMLGERVKKDDNYRHFYNDVAENEVIVISREKTPIFYYVISFMVSFIILFTVVTLFGLSRKKRKKKERNYYKSRITWLLMISLFVTLMAMAIPSINFILKRSKAIMNSSMADKIQTIQTMLEDRLRFISTTEDLNSQEVSKILEHIGDINSTDISLYSPEGMAFRSTAVQLFDRRILPMRINEKAYDKIVNGHMRYYPAREKIGSNSYRALYAPIRSASGTILAIVCAPYSDESFDLGSDAIIHTVFVVVIFIILLLFSRLGVGLMVNKMFRPLTEMSRKMNAAEIDHLEYIIYDRNDEISPLVRAYNLMVHDLSDSTRKLAVAERDKAWSGMARQVAHEIKNPLTPMKLQLQRLIRMKQKGDPSWVEKFDEISSVVLDHIDILAETANDFSTFAKLYSEDPVDIDLNKMLSEEISMYNNRENISFEYMGLAQAIVSGPKPQMTRVFVNLFNNAVQAIEGRIEDERQNGIEIRPGKIIVSLRNSIKEGFYDIVVEDNGPGVPEENRHRLFTPNFTTKSSGTGLGLAICRNIIEKCGGDISYSRSFLLGGACFTVRFPRK